MKVWITSDTHFGHTNIIKYENRPWDNAEDMNEGLIKNWNDTVGPHDVVLHLGDFGFMPRAKLEEIIKRLNGHIILIMGNHDRGRKPAKWEELGIDKVFDRPQILFDTFVFSHEPSSIEVPGMFYGYGHTHGSLGMPDVFSNKCYCVEQTNYKPVLFGEFFMSLDAFLTHFKQATSDVYHRNSDQWFAKGEK